MRSTCCISGQGLAFYVVCVQIHEINENNIKVVTTKEMYMARMEDLLIPPKAELKFPLVNFSSACFGTETEGSDVLYNP